MKEKKILPPTYMLLALIMMIGLHCLLPVTHIIGTPWKLLGTILIGVGLMMNVIASNAFSQHKTAVKPYEEPSALVTDGLFRVSRNPMYLGAVLLLNSSISSASGPYRLKVSMIAEIDDLRSN
jgi:protein-S-isoprenylcysteine O-methyltransferase Ste14